jgi:hypothetical protein
MMPSRPIGVGLGAAALTTSALLFAVFPLVRPFFRLDVFSPTLAEVASGPLASPPWVAAHLLLTLAFALLPLGLIAIATALAETPAARRARRGTLVGVVGIGLVLPAVGVETYAMPVLGRLYLDGVTGVAPALAWMYRGPMTLVMLVGLLLLALGAVDLARAAWRSGLLPRGGAVALAVGLALWLPLLPRSVRVADGLLIGIGGVWLGWALWRKGRAGAATGEPIAAPAERGVDAYRTL